MIVFVYDIPDDKRRERLRKTLLRFGTPVQYSVFECDLNPRQLKHLEQAVRGLIKPEEDNVRYYGLCRSCVQSTEVFGGQPLAKRKEVYVV